MNERVVSRRLKNGQRGVTLIALVVSIIAMVITAGVSISVLNGEDGIMTRAQIAKDKKNMSDYEEKMKLEAINAKSEANLEGNIKENFINRLENLDWVSEVKTPDTDDGLEANQIKVITKDGYEFVYNINESADLELVSQSVNGKPYATITLEQIGLEGTANEAIKVRVTTSIEEGGQITKLECIETGVEKENPGTVEEFEVPGSGTYKFKATTKDGNTTTKKITIAINTVSNTITMTPNPATSRNTGEAGTQNGIAKGPIVLTINYGETELTKQYKKAGDTNWTNVPGISTTVNVTSNESYVARYYDGTNGYNQETYNIVNVDNVAPTFTASNVVAIADGVNVTFTITTPATDEASEGASNTTAGILRYEYRLEDGTIGTTDASTLTKTLTSSKLGDQKVYVKAIDKAGNATEVEKDVTVTVANTTMNITASPVTPRNTENTGTKNGVETGPITLTINYGVSNLQKQYKKQGDANWTTTEETEVTINNITENCAYVARYFDGTTGVETEIYNIVNVDNTNPTFESSYVGTSVTDTTITATVNTAATDASGILRYEFSIDGGSYQAGDTDTTKAFTVSTIGDHTVRVKAIDNAGNETIVERTANVDIASSGISMSVSPTTARNTGTEGTQNGVDKGPITLTINYGTTSFTKQYKKQGDSSWTTVNGNSVQVSVTENCSYVARYFDGTTGRETSAYGITNVDNVAPTFPAENLTVTANSQGTITATITAATDTASTGAASTIPGILRYEYKLGDESYGIGATNLSTSKTFTVTEEGSYTVYVKAIDKAGNEMVRSKTINISAISKNISTAISSASQYGEYINLGTNLLPDRTAEEKTDWRILYKDTADGNKVYAILTDYLPNSNNIAYNAGLTKGTGNYATYGVKSSTSGTDLVNKLGVSNTWKTGLFNGTGLAINSKYNSVTARGAVTAETILASYNAKYNASLIISKSTLQYFYKNNNSSEGYDDLYVRATKSNCYGYWLATLTPNNRWIHISCE